MISGKEIKVLDHNSDYFGVPPAILMENAGKGAADILLRTLDAKGKALLFLCGTGNNGGDGFVAARYLAEFCNVSIILTGKYIRTIIAKQNFLKLQKQNVTILTKDSLSSLEDCIQKQDIIVDAMLGIGFSGTLKEPYATITRKLSSLSKITIVSLDVPTGLGTSPAVQPQHTITFHDSKEGMDAFSCGSIHIVDIGIPKDALEYIGPGELIEYYPRPIKQSHKGENGRVLIVGGGPYIGAPALCGLAALRTGVDLVHIATPQRSWQPIASFSPNLIVHDLNSDLLTLGDLPFLRELMPSCDALCIGPGLGKEKETEAAIVKIILLAKEQQKPLVIDADAIGPIAQHVQELRHTPTVITPHAREFKLLTGVVLPFDIEKRSELIHEWAQRLGVTILFKGPIDIISNGKEVKKNKIHNESMTVGGTGDVLAGIITGLLSKEVIPYNAARIAAFLNGSAGNEAFQKKSYGLLATDIIDEIPSIFKKYL